MSTRREVLIAGGLSALSAVASAAESAPDEKKCTAHRPLRRKARELTLDQAKEVIDFTEHAVLSTCDLEGHPYGVPITPVRVGNKIYFHGTGMPGGRKTDNMLMNPNVSISYVGKATTLPEWYSVDYASAIVTGKAYPVTDPKEFADAFAAILKRHAPKNSAVRNEVQMKVRGPMAQVWRVDIEEITGKARGASKWVTGKSIHEVQDMGPSKWLKDVPL